MLRIGGTRFVCKAHAKNGFTHLKIGGYLANTPSHTLLLAHVREV